MPAVPQGSIILVTGVNGYIASHTARDAFKAEYMRTLFNEKYGEGLFQVQIVDDMAVDGAFDEVIKGCAGVMHVATDLTLSPNPNEVIPMVVAGVKNALTAAAHNPSVKRFVYTSSSSAATAPLVDKVFHIDANTWNHADVEAALAPPPYNNDRGLAVYAASKTLAEEFCWRFVEEEKPGFVVNTVLPNCNIGGILSKEQPASTGGWYKKMWEGDKEILKLLRDQFAPQHHVNVTDTAILHIAALVEEDVVGERLMAFAAPFNFNDTADVMEKLDADGYGDGKRRFERIQNASRDLKTVDTERAVELLRRYKRLGFASLETSLREMIESLTL